jgi:hypothetical protein
LLQQPAQKKLLASDKGKVRLCVPVALLRSAFGDAWQQAGFKVQLSVFKDATRIAGMRAAPSSGCALLMKSHPNLPQMVHVGFKFQDHCLCVVFASCDANARGVYNPQQQ